MDKEAKRRKNIEVKAGNGLTEIKEIKISDLVFDDRNANKGTDLGKELLYTSVSKLGIGRGVLADKNLKLIAGNHAVKEISEQGYERVIVVPTDGKTLVVTQRLDIDKDSKEGHELALADNRVTQANLSFDVDVIRDLDAQFNLDLADLAININEDGPIFPRSDENETDGAYQMETDFGRQPDNSVYQGNDEKPAFEQSFFPLSIALTKAERLAFDMWKKEKKVHTDTEAFQLIFKIIKA